MTKPTGNPPGRPKGARNKRTVEVEVEAKGRAAAAAIEAVTPGAFKGDAHAFLVAIYKDPAHTIELRLDAAKAAVRYEKPSLAAIDVTGDHEHTVHVIRDEPMSADEWAAEFALKH